MDRSMVTCLFLTHGVLYLVKWILHVVAIGCCVCVW